MLANYTPKLGIFQEHLPKGVPFFDELTVLWMDPHPIYMTLFHFQP